MKYNLKYRVLYPAALLVSACNPIQQVKEAVKAKQTNDSILNEFNKINEQLKEANNSLKTSNDSLFHYYDSMYKKQ